MLLCSQFVQCKAKFPEVLPLSIFVQPHYSTQQLLLLSEARGFLCETQTEFLYSVDSFLSPEISVGSSPTCIAL
jgi:hypothetical protein